MCGYKNTVYSYIVRLRQTRPNCTLCYSRYCTYTKDEKISIAVSFMPGVSLSVPHIIVPRHAIIVSMLSSFVYLYRTFFFVRFHMTDK